KDLPGERDETLPLVGREQQNAKEDAVDGPQHVDREVPPACEPDGMAQAWDAKPAGQRDGIVLGGPHAVRRHGMREPEPLRSWGAVAIPIKPRVIGQDLDTGAHDEEHEEHVQQVLHAQPPWKADYGGPAFGVAREDVWRGLYLQ